MKSFILNLTRLLIFSLIPILAVTFLGDASALFYKSKFYDDLEGKMTSEKLIEVQSNHDERIFKKTLLKANTGKKFNCVIFGSSRVLLVTSNHSLNLGVSGASLEDILGLYQILKKQNITMDTVLIGVDPWLFYSSDNRWKSISSYYHEYLQTNDDKLTNERLLQLINPTYFKESLRQLISHGIKSPYVFHDSMMVSHSGNLIFPLGNIRYGNDYREVDKKTVNAKVDSYLLSDNHFPHNSNISLERYRIRLFEEFVSHLNSRGIVVGVMFSPYHPRVYTEFVKKYKSILQTESTVRNIDNIDFYYGSYDPSSLTVLEDEFYDGLHLKELGIQRLLMKRTNISADVY